MSELSPVTGPNVPPEARERCARAIGADLITDARRIANATLEPTGPPVRVSDAGVVSDVRSLWISKRFEAFHRILLRFEGSAFENERWVGRRLRKRSASLLRHGGELLVFAQWLREFDDESLVGLYAEWAEAFARSSGILVVLAASDSADEVLRLRQTLKELWDEAQKCSAALGVLMSDELADEFREEPSLPEVVFGETPAVDIVDHGSARRAYPGGRRKLLELLAPQFRLIWPPVMFVPAEDEANFMNMALKVGGSYAPLLANRSASLVGALVRGAAAVDMVATGELIMDFHMQQAGRIMDSARGFRECMSRSAADPDGPHALDAYRNLAEGVLRPYGSLLVQLRVRGGAIPRRFKVFGTLGELEAALGSASDELIELARLGLSSQLRNYRAHENVVRTGLGTLAVVTEDGSLVDVDLADVWWRVSLLRSFLDGLDVAVQVAFANISEHMISSADIKPVITEAMLEFMASIAAGEFTQGSVTGLQVVGDTATIEFEGPTGEREMRLFAGALRRVLDPTVTEIRIVLPDGSLAFEDPST